MSLSSDVRRCVIFLGHGGVANFDAKGTAFLFYYEYGRYLVTAKHVAVGFGDDPFVIRINKPGGSDTIAFDPHTDSVKHPWFYHPDETVDLAIMPLHVDFSAYDIQLIPESMLPKPPTDEEHIGIGDLCYAVGLFKPVAGKGRNVQVLHTGNIALMPGDERVPVRDWRDPHGRSTIMSEGYLIELANLPGLSGAPVFVRPTHNLDLSAMFEGGEVLVTVPRNEISLLGVWSSSWDGNEIGVSRSQLEEIRVPVGMGFVTPAERLKELLDSESVAAERDEYVTRAGG